MSVKLSVVAPAPATVDYHVVNAIGTLLFTAADPMIAAAWLDANVDLWPDAEVRKITTIIRSVTVYRPTQIRSAA